MTSVAIPPYSSGQFGPSPPRLDVPFLGNESQSLRTAQGNSDFTSAWTLLRQQAVAIPPYSSGQFGHGPPGHEGPGRQEEVAIPPYSSGQFGPRASQALDSRPLSRPFWITSEIRLAFHLRTSPFQLAPLRLNAWIPWSYGHPDNLPVKVAFWAWRDSWLAHPPPPGATLVKEPEEQDTPPLPLYDTERRGFVGRDSQEEDGFVDHDVPAGRLRRSGDSDAALPRAPPLAGLGRWGLPANPGFSPASPVATRGYETAAPRALFDLVGLPCIGSAGKLGTVSLWHHCSAKTTPQAWRAADF